MSNGVLSSTVSASSSVTTWPLPPSPTNDTTNTTANVSLTFENRHSVIDMVTVNVSRRNVV